MKLKLETVYVSVIWLYFSAAVLTFGHSYSKLKPEGIARCSKLTNEIHRDSCYADIKFSAGIDSMMAGFFWPMYLSIKLWE